MLVGSLFRLGSDSLLMLAKLKSNLNSRTNLKCCRGDAEISLR